MISFTNFLADVTTIFVFVVWFWLLILIFGDLFRRHDISGWLNVVWVLIVILTSYIGVFIFIYLITQGRGIAERNAQQEQAARGAAARGWIQCRRRNRKTRSTQEGRLDHRRRIRAGSRQARSVTARFAVAACSGMGSAL